MINNHEIPKGELVQRITQSFEESGVYLTDTERGTLYAVEERYEPLFEAASKAEQDIGYPWPDVSAFLQGISPDRNPDEWRAANKRAVDAIRAWEANAPQEWKDAQDRITALNADFNRETNTIYKQALNRQYAELISEPGKIVPRAKAQADRLIADQHTYYTAVSDKVYSMSAYDVVALGGKEWKLDAAETRKRILEVMGAFHFKALGDNAQAIDEIKAYIEQAILTSPYIAPEGTPGANEQVTFREHPKPGSVEEAIAGLGLSELTRTVYPTMAISLIDKASKIAFAGKLTEQLQPLAMERRKGLKKIDTLVNINFSAPELQGLKGLNLTHYEKSVMEAIISLYIAGNEYMTLQMIYQAMRGDGAARLSPTQAKELSDCITKFMYGGIRIDATQEAKAYKLPGSVIYDTNLLHIERVMHNLNGTITECIHIIKTPVLYEYASSKGQIGRVPMAAIATPLDKNKETFALQSYLLERILGMRGGDKQRDIAYSSIYSATWGKEASAKEPQSGYTRVKKSRLRKKAFDILTHWTMKGTVKDGGALIKGYEEYPQEKTARGITIIL